MKKLLANLFCILMCMPLCAMYLSGTANPDGSSADKAVQMKKDGCTYVWYGTLNDGNLQFLTQKSASASRYVPTTATKSVTLNQVMPVQKGTSTSTNVFSFKAGIYTLSLDTVYNTLTVVGTAGQTIDTGDNLYLIGPATSAAWVASDAIKMERNENVYTYTGTFTADEMKFLTSKGNWNPCYVATSKNQQVSTGVTYNLAYRDSDGSSTPDYKFIMPAGTFTVTVTLNTTAHTGTMVVSGETPGPGPGPTPGPEYPLTGLKIVGLFSNWTPQDMEEIGTGQFKYTGNFNADDDFKFRYADGWWPGFVAIGSGNQELHQNETLNMKYYKTEPAAGADLKWYFSTAGSKTVYVDLNKLTVSTIVPTDVAEANVDNGTSVFAQNKNIYISNIATDCEYILMNATGKIISKGELKSGDATLNVQNSGLYILNTGSETYKIIIY